MTYFHLYYYIVNNIRAHLVRFEEKVRQNKTRQNIVRTVHTTPTRLKQPGHRTTSRQCAMHEIKQHRQSIKLKEAEAIAIAISN